jgi:pterin-4a-carbinolamine dehydratase
VAPSGLELSWGQVDVVIFNHKIRGLTDSDFVLGAKIDHLYFQGNATRPEAE